MGICTFTMLRVGCFMVLTLAVCINAQKFVAKMAVYPEQDDMAGYFGPLRLQGAVTVSENKGGGLDVAYDLWGAPPNFQGGIHIHTGLSCTSALGHFWTPTSSPDPWKDPSAMYKSDSAGFAKGSFSMDSGYMLKDVASHAVVIHGVSADDMKTRVACGVLGTPAKKTKKICKKKAGAYASVTTDAWCNNNCNNVPANCPKSHCICTGPLPILNQYDSAIDDEDE